MGTYWKDSCLLRAALATTLVVLLTGCGDDETAPDPGVGGGGEGGGQVECTEEDPFDPAECPASYPGTDCVVRVDNGVPSAGDGSSWQEAVQTVQEGIDLARCGVLNAGGCAEWQVWVKQGTYFIHQACRFDMVHLRPNVGVYGGFDGTESALFDRDLQSNETILDGRDGPDGQSHVYHVVVGADDAVLDGFIIQHGRADDPDNFYYQHGAGMSNADASPTVENCTFRDNYAVQTGAGMVNAGESSTLVRGCTFERNHALWDGGGMADVLGSQPTVVDCVFRDNVADHAGGGLLAYQASPTVTDCTFENNAAYVGGGMSMREGDATVAGGVFSGNHTFESERDWPSGGGLAIADASVTVNGVVFTGNSSALAGGGMNIGDAAAVSMTGCTFTSNTASDAGGGVMIRGSDVTLESCVFRDNSAVSNGGGVALGDSTTDVARCTFDNNETSRDGGGLSACCGGALTVAESVFTNNEAGSEGGGLSAPGVPIVVDGSAFSGNSAANNGGGLMTGAAVMADLTNSTFHGNSAREGSAIEGGDAGSLTLLNCSVALNTATTSSGAIRGAADLTVTNSILWANGADSLAGSGTTALAVTYSDVEGGHAGDGNINAAPAFEGLGAGDLHLRSTSPCIGAASEAAAPAIDMEGNARDGEPDMGAYEYPAGS